jgi:hypothetical protein
MDEESKRDAIARLLAGATAEKNEEKRNITISGNGNVIGNGNSVVVTEKHVTVTKVIPKPGAEHITETQVARLHELKNEIIRLEQLAKKTPATHHKVWASFNKKMKIGRMRMLPLEKFKDGEKFLLTWMNGLLSTKSAAKKDPEGTRRQYLGKIHARMQDPAIEQKVRAYLQKNFNTNSLANLPDLEDVKRVYRYTAGLKTSPKISPS